MDNEKQATSGRFEFPLSEGLLLAPLPVAIYLLAFAYEQGFAGEFGIPPMAIQVSVTSLLITGSYFCLVAFIALYIFTFASTRIREDERLTTFAMTILLTTMAGAPSIIFRTSIFERLLGVGILVLVAGVIFFLIDKQWKRTSKSALQLSVKSLSDEAKAISGMTDAERASPEGAARIDTLQMNVDNITRRLKLSLLSSSFAILVFVFVTSAYQVGATEASSKNSFLTKKSGNTQFALLRIYGDNMVLAVVENQHIINKLRFQKVGDAEGEVWEETELVRNNSKRDLPSSQAAIDGKP